MDGLISAFRGVLSYTDWQHAEIEDQETATTLRNKQLTYRGVFEQRPGGRWSGSFGFSGVVRNYESRGEETLAPPTDQQSFAGFILEELQTEHARFQLGGRLEHVRYSPDGLNPHQFTGLSGGAASTWDCGRMAPLSEISQHRIGRRRWRSSTTTGRIPAILPSRLVTRISRESVQMAWTCPYGTRVPASALKGTSSITTFAISSSSTRLVMCRMTERLQLCPGQFSLCGI